MTPSRIVAAIVVALAAVVAAAPAQQDRRDRVVRRDGRELRGRVVQPHGDGDLVLLQGGRRVRVARDDVASTDLVGARVAAFCERRVRQRDQVRAQQFLVDQAAADELPGLARLQATWLVLRDDGDEAAHRFLGHERGPDGWLWPHAGARLTRERLDAALAREPMVLRGERFTLRCSAGLTEHVDALFDLEQLGVAWYAAFGEDLALHEVLEPIALVTWPDAASFPKWGFRPVPYFVPPPHGDEGRTFWLGARPQRPEQLFFVGTQGLLYRSLIGEADRGDSRDRVCAWLEIGLGTWMQHTMQGPPGFAAPGAAREQDVQALQALSRSYRLTHLVHLPMYGSFYLTDDNTTGVNWSAAAAFVAWLLRDDNQPPTRAPFLRYVLAALRERHGDSSSTFDRVFGRRIEELDAPWRQWLTKTAGQ